MEGQTTGRIIVQQAGYSRERLLGGVTILKLRNAEPESVDAWYQDCLKLMSRWQPGQRLRYMHDIRNAEQITSYGLERVIDVLRRLRTIPVSDAKGAVVLKKAALADLLGSFLKRRPTARWEIRFYYEPQEALNWLQQK